MSYLKLLNIQGIAGLAVSVCLALLLVIQKGDTRHWRKQSGQFELLYRGEQAAFAGTIANYRAAVDAAEAADRAASQRVAAEQRDINQRSQNALDSRLALARSAAVRLRGDSQTAHANPRSGPGAGLPRLPAAAAGTAEAAGQDRLPVSEERARADRGALGLEDALIATEQAIQLDELIGWVKRQHAVEVNTPQPSPR